MTSQGPPEQRRPLSEEQRKLHKDVVEGAWDRRNAERRRLAHEREAAHTEIERNYYTELSNVDARYDNDVHEGLNALRRSQESGAQSAD